VSTRDTSSTIDAAQAIVDGVEADRMSVDLRSLSASFVARVKAGETRAAYAYARAVVKLAAREGLKAKRTGKPKKADLIAEIEAANLTRGADEQLPTSGTVPELEALLESIES
tara:strand:- start:110 stop:448 length:339 start_codon:yes stop_codon:yes gene_type:complete